MIDTQIIGLLAFLSIFHLIGGAAVGITLRSWTDDPAPRNLLRRVFLLVWGGMFGCMPLVLGVQNGPQVLAVQMAVLLMAILVPFFWLERLREIAANQNLMMMSMGGVFMVAGMAVGGFLLRQREWLAAALFGGVFGLTGGSLFFFSLHRLLSGSEDE